MIALVVVGCSTFQLSAKTDIGKAVQTADIEKALVTEAMTQFAVLHFQGKVTDETYAKGRTAYGTWAQAQTTVAKSIAAWKRIGDAQSGQAVMVAIGEAQKVAASLLNLLGQWGVDIGSARAKVGG
jgi:hypothetical protein